MLNDFIKERLQSNLNGTSKLNIHALQSASVDHQLFSKQNCQKQNWIVTISSEILIFAAIFSLYDSKPNRLYIEKIDTSGYDHHKGIATVTTQAIVEFFARKYPELIVHVYAATSDQYIFHKSAENGKSCLTDTGLIKWWIKCLSMTISGINIKRNWLVIGEEMAQARNLCDFDGWGWSLGSTLNISNLPLFDDDIVQKTMKYAQEVNNINEFIELMALMENSSQRRAILTVSYTNSTHSESISHDKVDIEVWQQLLKMFDNSSFSNKEEAIKSSNDITKFLTKHSKEPSVAVLVNGKENFESKPEKIESVNAIQNLVKRKATIINNISGLVKKKK